MFQRSLLSKLALGESYRFSFESINVSISISFVLICVTINTVYDTNYSIDVDTKYFIHVDIKYS